MKDALQSVTGLEKDGTMGAHFVPQSGHLEMQQRDKGQDHDFIIVSPDRQPSTSELFYESLPVASDG